MFIDEIQEVEPEETNQEEAEGEQPESTDPLDTLSEAELRAEAKKYRAIASRKKEKEEKPDEYLKKSDVERANENKAKALLQKSDDPAAKAILEHWADLAPIYGKVASRGKLTDEDIVEDLKDALAVYQRTQAAPKIDTKEAEAKVAVITGTGGTSPKDSTPKRERIIRSQTPMSDWYKTD